MEIHLMGSLSRAGFYMSYPNGAVDTMTAVSKDLLNDPYLCTCACAHLWVKFNFLSQNILPNWLFFFFFNSACHMKLLSIPILSKKKCADLTTNFSASCFPKCPGYLCRGASIFDTWAHISFTPPSTNIGFGREHNAQFCIELTELNFSPSFLDPGIIFF